jgi:hypothetical protein
VRSRARPAKEVQVLCRYTYSGLESARNCAAARRGGEQRETAEPSVAQANSIRPDRLASLRSNGEARTCEEREAHDAEGLGDKAIAGAVWWLETEGFGGMGA